MAQKEQKIDQVRKKIEKTMELAEEERKRKLMSQRLEQARGGIAAFKQRKIGDAVRSFHSYIKTLEDLKGVPEGGLTPALFDIKKDQQELLMISAIYWDLVKLYDRTRSKGCKKEFDLYFQKYILFSKGMPFQPLCSETLRKYISSDKANHRSEFANAYRILSINKCFIVSSLIDVIAPQTLWDLRQWRDEVLQSSFWGRITVECYYMLGPHAAELMSRSPQWMRKGVGKGFDLFARFLVQNRAYTIRSKNKFTI